MQNTAAKILVVDDDPTIISAVRSVLTKEGFEVHAATEGDVALRLVESEHPDLVVLDIELNAGQEKGQNQRDGMDILRHLRSQSDICVLMLTSTDIQYMKRAAFEIGADDYVTKPCDYHELAGRIRAILRRAHGARQSQEVPIGNLSIDLGRRTATKEGKALALTPIEFDLLRVLIEAKGDVVSRHRLIVQAWPYNYSGDERLVDVHIGRLRKKIEDNPAEPSTVLTVWGRGYRLAAEGA